MSMARELQPAFTPEALSTFDDTMDEVWNELLAEGVLSPSSLDTNPARTKLARRLIRFASSGWSATQIKQLLVRAFRNEQSAAWHRTGRRKQQRLRP